MSDAAITIRSHDDDSVTVEVGGLQACIRAADWKEANEAAHLLGQIVAGRIQVRDLSNRLRVLHQQVAELEGMFTSADRLLLDICEVAA